MRMKLEFLWRKNAGDRCRYSPVSLSTRLQNGYAHGFGKFADCRFRKFAVLQIFASGSPFFIISVTTALRSSSLPSSLPYFFPSCLAFSAVRRFIISISISNVMILNLQSFRFLMRTASLSSFFVKIVDYSSYILLLFYSGSNSVCQNPQAEIIIRKETSLYFIAFILYN